MKVIFKKDCFLGSLKFLYNHFLNSGIKNFEALYQRQINEFWQDIQVGHWKCSEKDVW